MKTSVSFFKSDGFWMFLIWVFMCCLLFSSAYVGIQIGKGVLKLALDLDASMPANVRLPMMFMIFIPAIVVCLMKIKWFDTETRTNLFTAGLSMIGYFTFASSVLLFAADFCHGVFIGIAFFACFMVSFDSVM